MALEALEEVAARTGARWALEQGYAGHLEAITAIKQALSAPTVQESDWNNRLNDLVGIFKDVDQCGPLLGMGAAPAQPAPVQDLPFGVGGGLVAIKTLLSRDPCVHANTAIEMIDAILKEHPAAQPAVPLTDEMVTAAARALNKRQAEACGVDKNDHWKFYGDDIKEDAKAALEAAHGITKGQP
jgi:hypothetical protein